MDTRGESIFNAEIPGRNTAGLPHISAKSAGKADSEYICGKQTSENLTIVKKCQVFSVFGDDVKKS